MPQVTDKKSKTPEQALSRLMTLCSRGEKSSGDALRLMRGWGIEPAERAKILKTLLDQRFIDDARYASAFVCEKTRLSGWGAYKMRAALAAKGIDRTVIDAALGQIDPVAAGQRLERYLRSKLARLTGTPYEVRGKLLRYGASLGYDYDAVSTQVDKLLKDEFIFS